MTKYASSASSRRGRCVCVLAFPLLLSSTAFAGPPPPAWWEQPHKDDHLHLYVKASAEKQPTEQEARAKAYGDALALLARRVSVQVDLKGDGTSNEVHLRSSERLVRTNIEFEDTKEHRGKWYAWVLVTYPREEYERLLADFRAPFEKWETYRGLVREKRLQDARPLARDLLTCDELSVASGAALLANAYVDEGRHRDALVLYKELRSAAPREGDRAELTALLKALAQQQFELALSDVRGADSERGRSVLAVLTDTFPVGRQSDFDTLKAVFALVDADIRENRKAAAYLALVQAKDGLSNADERAPVMAKLQELGEPRFSDYMNGLLGRDGRLRVEAGVGPDDIAVRKLVDAVRGYFVRLSIACVGSGEGKRKASHRLVIGLKQTEEDTPARPGVTASAQLSWRLTAVDDGLEFGHGKTDVRAVGDDGEGARTRLLRTLVVALKNDIAQRVDWRKAIQGSPER